MKLVSSFSSIDLQYSSHVMATVQNNYSPCEKKQSIVSFTCTNMNFANTMYFHCATIISPLEKDIGFSFKTMLYYVGVIFFWTTFEFPSPNDTVCLVWLRVNYEELCYNNSNLQADK